MPCLFRLVRDTFLLGIQQNRESLLIDKKIREITMSIVTPAIVDSSLTHSFNDHSKEGFDKLEENQITLLSYENGVDEYIDRTSSEVSGIFQTWINKTLSLIQTHAHILEVGSGFGRDARYIESLGFMVERTDAAEGFVKRLQKEGYSARLFNVLIDEFRGKYDLIFANCVFLHFSPKDLDKILHKVYDSLETGGILSFSVKRGEGEVWSTEKLAAPRYFCYWKKESIKILVELACFEVVSISQDEKFLQIIAKKK
jgi:SAM-dependent methyltransferase